MKMARKSSVEKVGLRSGPLAGPARALESFDFSCIEFDEYASELLRGIAYQNMWRPTVSLLRSRRTSYCQCLSKRSGIGPMTGGTWRGAVLGLGVAGSALVWLGAEVVRLGEGDGDAYVADLTALALGALALWFVFTRLAGHFRGLERLETELGSVRTRLDSLGGGSDPHRGEVGRLAVAVADALRRERHGVGPAGGDLTVMVALVEQPVLVLSEGGRIVALNPPAVGLLGAPARAGADVRMVLDRLSLARGIEQARAAAAPVAAELHRADGTTLSVRIADLGLRSGAVIVFRPAEQPLRLPDPPVEPAVGPIVDAGFDSAAPIGATRFTAISIRTRIDSAGGTRVSAVAAVRLSGPRVFPTLSVAIEFDDGIDHRGRPFAAGWPVLADTLHGTVVAGLDVPEAFRCLLREGARAGLPPWAPPPALDLGALATALDPGAAGEGIEALARRFGAHPVLPDTPDGEAHAVAALASVLFMRLAEAGVDTLGALERLDPRSLVTASAASAPP